MKLLRDRYDFDWPSFYHSCPTSRGSIWRTPILSCFAPRFPTGSISFKGSLSWSRHWVHETHWTGIGSSSESNWISAEGLPRYVLSFLFWLHWFNENEDAVHHSFRFCCVKASQPSPKLLEDLCGLDLAIHIFCTSESRWSDVESAELMCWFGRQVCPFRSVHGLPCLMHNIYSG